VDSYAADVSDVSAISWGWHGSLKWCTSPWHTWLDFRLEAW